ncbi:MAG: M20/M25/M40 family metallo-hydrolase [Pseudomonadota bacterium]
MSKIDMNRFLSTFSEFVKIPSESPNDQEFISYLEKYFGKMNGVKTVKDSYGNLIVKVPAKNSSSKNTVGFVAHADTVSPGVGIKPIVENGIVKTNGTTILAADDKAGIAQITEMLLCAEKHPPIEVIITRCEEPGDLGSLNLNYSLVDSKMAYVLDMEYPDRIVVGGPTTIAMDVSYKGRPAHAGMAPEKGISSIIAASKAIAKLRLGKLDDETTANVGTIQGGEVRNGIPEHTKILVECRSLNQDKAEKLADEMETIFKQSAKEVGAEVMIDRNVLYRAYLLSEDSDAVNCAKAAIKKNGLNPITEKIRGGTDAANFNAHKIPTAVLGIGYRDIHSCNETLILKEAETLIKVIIDIVEGLA